MEVLLVLNSGLRVTQFCNRPHFYCIRNSVLLLMKRMEMLTVTARGMRLGLLWFLLTASKLAPRISWYRTPPTCSGIPTKLPPREDTIVFPSMSLGLVAKAGGETYQTTVAFGSRCQPCFKWRGKKKRMSFQSHARAWEDYNKLICSLIIYLVFLWEAVTFVCYFEIAASPQGPKNGARKDPN